MSAVGASAFRRRRLHCRARGLRSEERLEQVVTQTTTVTDHGTNAQIIVGSGAGASAKMPDYAPLYPGAEVQTSVNASGSSAGGMVMFKSKDSSDAVIAFYRKSAAAAGMANVVDTASGDTKAFTASSDTTHHSLSVVSNKSDDGVTVQVTWSDR